MVTPKVGSGGVRDALRFDPDGHLYVALAADHGLEFLPEGIAVKPADFAGACLIEQIVDGKRKLALAADEQTLTAAGPSPPP